MGSGFLRAATAAGAEASITRLDVVMSSALLDPYRVTCGGLRFTSAC
jgi:hypothetical protein